MTSVFKMFYFIFRKFAEKLYNMVLCRFNTLFSCRLKKKSESCDYCRYYMEYIKKLIYQNSRKKKKINNKTRYIKL